jgi:hypothetical protein
MFLGPKFQLNTLTSYTTELALTVLFGNIASFLAFYIDQRVECQINIYPFHTFSCLANPMETSKSEVKLGGVTITNLIHLKMSHHTKNALTMRKEYKGMDFRYFYGFNLAMKSKVVNY